MSKPPKKVPFGQEEISNYFPKRPRSDEGKDAVAADQQSEVRLPKRRRREPDPGPARTLNFYLDGAGPDDVLIGDHGQLTSRAQVVIFRTRRQFEQYFGRKPTTADEDATCTLTRDDRPHIAVYKDPDSEVVDDGEIDDNDLVIDRYDDSDVTTENKKYKRHLKNIKNPELGTYRSKPVIYYDIARDQKSTWQKQEADTEEKFSRRMRRSNQSSKSFHERGLKGLLEGHWGEYDTPAGKLRRSKHFVDELQAGERNPPVLIRTPEGAFMGIYLTLYEDTKDIRTLTGLLDKFGKENVWFKDIKFKYKTIDVYDRTAKIPEAAEKAFFTFSSMSRQPIELPNSAAPAQLHHPSGASARDNGSRALTISPNRESPRAPAGPVRRLVSGVRSMSPPAGRSPSRPPFDGQRRDNPAGTSANPVDLTGSRNDRGNRDSRGTRDSPIELD